MGMILGIHYGDLLYPNTALKILVGVFVILVGIAVVLFLPDRDPTTLIDTVAEEDDELSDEVGARVESSSTVSTTVVVKEGESKVKDLTPTSNDSGVTSDASMVSDGSSPRPVTPEVKSVTTEVKSVTPEIKDRGPMVHVLLKDTRNASSDENDYIEDVRDPERKFAGQIGKGDADASSLSSVPQTSDGEAF